MYPARNLVGDAPVWLLGKWYAELGRPSSDEERDTLEAICVRAEQLGLVNEQGRVQ